jgi:flagellin-like hook-associated protein FlgL
MNPINSRNGTHHSNETVLAQLAVRKTNLDQSQLAISTGKRINKVSDDPVGAAQAERSMTRIERIKVEMRAMDLQRSNLTLAESTLGEGIEYLQRVRELLVTAGNAALDSPQRVGIANEIEGLRNRLLQIANRQDSNGIALFGGLGSVAIPFEEDGAGIVSFMGVAGFAAQSDVSLPMALDGQSAFMFATSPDPNPSTSIFHALDKAILDLQKPLTNAAESAAMNAAIIQGLKDTDRGLSQLQAVRSQAGDFLNQSDLIEIQLNARHDQSEADRSRVQDLDMAQGISQMQSNQVAYEIALKSYAQSQQLSLFNFLK